MQRTNIYLDVEQRDRLDRRAREEGISRADLIRRLLDRGLSADDGDLESDLAAIDQSFGALAGVEFERRTDGDRSAHLDRMWHQT